MRRIPMLLYRMLSSLGHEARWIVDWADHVWTEILLDNNQWIHLDPCEAAVDKPLLYEEWKQQTYILGFYAPPNTKEMKPNRFPAIEDLTKNTPVMTLRPSIKGERNRQQNSTPSLHPPPSCCDKGLLT
ncbi:Transglutaminase-like superfamily [Fragilaria crotonensis]|nr:Transglutaminase-like superfamily [Fragilaria crotonensis]